MKLRAFFAFGLLLAAFGQSAFAQTVRFATTLGNIDVLLAPESAPLTVANFMNYVNKGAYNNTIFHRSVPGFIIQGGGFTFSNNTCHDIPADGPVQNEFRVSNTRGTIAMAKLGSDPNSATNQWFFNLANNASNLNSQNGGFTVFGKVADAASLAVMDKIAAVPVYSLASPCDQIPLQNYTSGRTATTANTINVNSITVVGTGPTITPNGVISASSFGGLVLAAPGSFIEIYGANLANTTRGWSNSDFTNGKAPTSLDGVSVTVGGVPAYVNYVSPTQVNVQVPAEVPTGTAAAVIVTNNGNASPSVLIGIRTVAAALLAPASFKPSGRQYVAAIHSTTGAFVSNGSIPDVPAAPAVPGEVLTLYGTGFGAVTGGTVAGQVATGTSAVSGTVDIRFGNVPAQVQYAGLAPGLVGLYQFNVVVPANLPSGDILLNVSVGGQPITQTLFIPIQ